jgi:hypothetical protein
MVNEDEQKIASIPPFALRMQRTLRTRVEAAARVNRRSVNSEIVARLAQSFDMAAPETDPGEIPTSTTAREAFALANALKDALRAVCDEKYIDRLPDEVQAIFIELGTRLLAL